MGLFIPILICITYLAAISVIYVGKNILKHIFYIIILHYGNGLPPKLLSRKSFRKVKKKLCKKIFLKEDIVIICLYIIHDKTASPWHSIITSFILNIFCIHSLLYLSF